MTTLTLNPSRPLAPAMRAEWTKLRSLRSSRWILLVFVLVTVGVGAAITAGSGSSYHSGSRSDWDPTNSSLVGMVFGQLAAVVIGVLAVTGEYATGTIRSSVAALPTRSPLLAAKAVVVGGIVLAVGEVIAFVSFWLGQAVLAGNAPTAAVTDPHVLRAVVLAGAYLALISLMSLGLGFVLRHTAGAIAVMVGLLLVLPTVLQALPSGVENAVGRFMPEQIAANSMAAVVPQSHAFGPWVGLLVLVSYTAITLWFGARLLRRRDV